MFLAREHDYFIAQLPDAATICPAFQNLEALACSGLQPHTGGCLNKKREAMLLLRVSHQ
jgi:hypothetical protein